MSLSDNLYTALDNLIGYFYVSETLRENSSAIFYDLEENYYGKYISELSVTPLERNLTKNVVYVMSHQTRDGNYSFIVINLLAVVCVCVSSLLYKTAVIKYVSFAAIIT